MCKKLLLNKVTAFFLVVLILSTNAYARDYSCIDPSRINRKALPVVPFIAPDLSDENILEVVHDIRPIRLSGVRIEPEYFKDKLIIHNYGYGGYGLSLCFGGSSEVLQLLKKELYKSPSLEVKDKVAVLGAGIVGLASAYDLLQKGFKVTVYADQFYPNVTSSIAAGIWTTPFQRELKTPEIAKRYQKMIATSEKRYFQSIGDNPEFKGVWLDTYYIFKGFLTYQRLLKFGNYTAIKRKYCIGQFDNGLERDGTAIRLLSMDGKKLINDLIKKLKDQGVNFKKRTFKSKKELLNLDEDILINCTSLGSEKLFGDKEFRPVQGHMIHFKNPKKIKYTAFFDVPEDPYFWISINTWEDRLILGGVIENDHPKKAYDPKIKEKLLKYARALLSDR